MKNFAKSVYYKFQKRGLLSSYNIKLGYIFHTEKIYNDAIFNKLILFCKEYNLLTGAKPICSLIPPTNFLLKEEMDKCGFSEKDFVTRVKVLSQFSTIGYHGHFYLDNKAEYYNAIHCNNYKYFDLKQQFSDDINWFEINDISHNGIYAAGWWFMNNDLFKLLIENDFKYDFSFSQAKFFYNQFSCLFMNENKIKFGDSFFLTDNNKINKLLCIQNFIGMHNTKYPQDFERIMNSLLPKNVDSNNSIVGVVNSHDYSLDFPNTLNCIKYLLTYSNVTFYSFSSLVRKIKNNTKEFIGTIPNNG